MQKQKQQEEEEQEQRVQKEQEIIVGRFFEAMYAIINNKETYKLRGKATFCKRCDINRGNLYQLEQDMSRGIFKAAWLTYLVRRFGVSAHWLLTGDGPMMKKPVGRPKNS